MLKVLLFARARQIRRSNVPPSRWGRARFPR